MTKAGWGRLRRWLRTLVDRGMDRYYSIDTIIWGLPRAAESSRFGDAHGNMSLSYWLLYHYLDRKLLSLHDSFYDIGCGYGRALCFVARCPLVKCVGIELSKEFAERARMNASRLCRRMSPIEVRAGDATDMDYSDGTVYFFSDPFGADTMRGVLARIYESLLKRPRRVRCIFIRAAATREQAAALDDAIRAGGWLVFSGERSLPYSPVRAEYWECQKSAAE